MKPPRLALTRRRFVQLLTIWAFARSAGVPTKRLDAVLARADETLTRVPIYLTFDDGIETELAEGKAGTTLDVLDVLDARGVPATFFLHGLNTGMAEGRVLARMLRAGHRIGNHLFSQGGQTLSDNPTPSFTAASYLDTEVRIREALAPYPNELALYTGSEHPHMFRRPGGGYDHPDGNLFLLPESGYWEIFKYDRLLARHRSRLHWLEGVYDYSGWHVTVAPLWMNETDPEILVRWAIRGARGVDEYLTPDQEHPEWTSQASLDGLVLLLHDPDPRIPQALPLLLDELDSRGASFHVLPRPADKPNSYTIGIARPIEVVHLVE